MKVYIVLKYYNVDGMYETCEIDRVYESEKRSQKRVNFLKRTTLNSDVTIHRIEKTLKGRRHVK